LQPSRHTRYQLHLHWPWYGLGLSVFAICILLIAVSAYRSDWGYVSLILVPTLIVGFLLVTNLRTQRNLANNPDDVVLYELSGIRQDESLALIDLGVQEAAKRLHRRQRQGKVINFNIYNPQIMPGAPISRAQHWQRERVSDPRLSWQMGQFDLLSLPDGAVPAVMIPRILSEIPQYGDRLALLGEAYRVLRPGGRLVVSEVVRTPTQWVLRGPFAMSLPTTADWRELLEDAGFLVRYARFHLDILACFRADKPTSEEVQQLIFEFGEF
jgi:hypothetical protein